MMARREEVVMVREGSAGQIDSRDRLPSCSVSTAVLRRIEVVIYAVGRKIRRYCVGIERELSSRIISRWRSHVRRVQASTLTAGFCRVKAPRYMASKEATTSHQLLLYKFSSRG